MGLCGPVSHRPIATVVEQWEALAEAEPIDGDRGRTRRRDRLRPAGFVAATRMRGIRLVLAPTTLLSMVDAGLGKTGSIARRRGRLGKPVGSFWPARLVLCDTGCWFRLGERSSDRDSPSAYTDHRGERRCALEADLPASLDGSDPAPIRGPAAGSAGVVARDFRRAVNGPCQLGYTYARDREPDRVRLARRGGSTGGSPRPPRRRPGIRARKADPGDAASSGRRRRPVDGRGPPSRPGQAMVFDKKTAAGRLARAALRHGDCSWIPTSRSCRRDGMRSPRGRPGRVLKPGASATGSPMSSGQVDPPRCGRRADRP